MSHSAKVASCLHIPAASGHQWPLCLILMKNKEAIL
uniref:Uncharacterized protein n=1 Tax=Rhizophora mucronata TaxID=61149 RepID=A0A2P2P8C2_RHIMU